MRRTCLVSLQPAHRASIGTLRPLFHPGVCEVQNFGAPRTGWKDGNGGMGHGLLDGMLDAWDGTSTLGS